MDSHKKLSTLQKCIVEGGKLFIHFGSSEENLINSSTVETFLRKCDTDIFYSVGGEDYEYECPVVLRF